MKKNYQKPVVSVDAGMAEGVYAASGAAQQGSLNVTYNGPWDKWDGGGKGLCSASWSDLTGSVTVVLNFNTAIDQVEVTGITAQTSISGNTATVTFNAADASSCMIGIHINNGTDIYALQMTGFSYSVK